MGKVLIQDIADSLGLSRTTVSKVLNSTGSVAPATRARVLQKAAEMNYKYFSLIPSAGTAAGGAGAPGIPGMATDMGSTPSGTAGTTGVSGMTTGVAGRAGDMTGTPGSPGAVTGASGAPGTATGMAGAPGAATDAFGVPGTAAGMAGQSGGAEPAPIQHTIAVFFSKTIDNQHMGFALLSIFGQTVSRSHFTLSLYPVSEEELHSLTLPPAAIPEHISAILCIEIFDRAYSEMLCSLKKPVLFIDAYAGAIHDNLKADIILMESQHHLSALIASVVRQYHLSRVGFVGPYLHCLSFYERWLGFHSALLACGLPYQEPLCILSQVDENYFNQDWLLAQLKRMEQLPELFVCTNDFAAFPLITVLRQLNLHVPSDVLVIGFDNSPQSSMSVPTLTTVDSLNDDIGVAAAALLMDRIQNPQLPSVTVHLPTRAVRRESTNRHLRT